MDEENSKKTENEEMQNSGSDSNKGFQSAAGEETGGQDIVKETRELVERMEKANKEKERLLKREEEVISKRELLNSLGGNSNAGQSQQKPKEESNIDYMKKVMSGGLNKENDEED